MTEKCKFLTGKAKNLCEKDKLLINAHLMNMVSTDNWEHGQGMEHSTSLSESKSFKNMEQLKKWIGNYGLDLDKFWVFDGEENRLEYNRNEDNDGNEITLTEERPDGYVVDYSLYIEMYEEIKTDLNKMKFKKEY